MASLTGLWRRRGLRLVAILVVAAAAIVALRAGARPPADASISVSPQTGLLDEPATVAIRGLSTGRWTTITATATDAAGTTWSSSARFQATPAGEVSLDQLSTGRLFDLMTPEPDSSDAVFRSPDAGYDVTLSFTVGNRVAGSTTAHRLGPAAAGVTTKELRPAGYGLHGDLYLPENTATRRPAVLVFGGSDGGLSTGFAASLLAAHGYPSLALAYVGEPGLPPTLADVPLEYFARALGLLRAQPGVDPRHLLVSGVSRGSEAALLLGVHFPWLVSGVIAGVPSSVVNPGLPDSRRPAWTLRGRPVPSVSPADFGRPAPPDKPEAVIPVEKIRGPILLTCGGLDVVWASGCAHTDAIAERLAAHGFRYAVTVLRYPDAGHHIGGLTAYFPSLTEDALTRFGGTVAATQAAQADAHAELLAFLAAQ